MGPSPEPRPETRTPAGCPGRGELLALSRGRLGPDRLEAVGRHLETCPACSAALAALADDSDPLIGNLRGAAPTAPGATEETCSRLAERARDIPFLAPPTQAGAPTDTAPAPAPLGQLGPYRLVRQLGGGGMGVVYEAWHTRLQRRVALKTLRPDWAPDPRMVARFHREWAAVGRLDHPNLVRATDAGEVAGCHFLVMEFVDGPDLGKVARQVGPLRVADACEVGRQVALALQYIHERGMVHRDVKPSNLMLTAAGEVKLLDLGLALLYEGHAAHEELSEAGQRLGTADYMAPEQAADAHGVGPPADLYSLGCTLYKLLSGRPPFAGPEYSSVTKKVKAHAGTAAAPPAVGPGLPEGLGALLERLLAKAPADRPAPAAEVARALARYSEGHDLRALAAAAGAAPAAGGGAGLTETVSHRGAPGVGRRRRALAVLALLLLIGAPAGWLATHRPGHPPGAPGLTVADEPGKEYDLLAAPPRVLRWPDASPNSRWDHDAAKRELWVHCDDYCAFELADVRGAGYELEMTLFQDPWVGGVGVFVRGRDEAAPGGPGVFADLLLLKPFGREVGGPGPLLAVGNLRRASPGGKVFATTLLAEPFRSPLLMERRLAVRVGERGLEAISWDGTPVAAKLHSPQPQIVPRTGAGGTVGVYAQSCNVLVRSARLRLRAPQGD